MPRLKKIGLLLAVFFTFQCSLQAKVISTLGGLAPAGTVSPLYGKISVTNSAGYKKRPSSITSIFRGDTIRTETDAYAELRLSDGSIINLGAKSGVRIEEFSYDRDMDEGKMTLRIISGIYRFTTGRMRANASENIKIILPVGNVTLRNATVLGQIFDKRAVTILWKSPLKVESFEPLAVRTRENDPVYETVIEKLGFGCVVEDENYSPTPAVKIPENDIAWIEYKLSPFSARKKETEPVKKTPEFSIQAIVYDQEDSSQSRLVVVNGKIYKEGDIVEDHRILMIDPKTVAVKNMSTGETKNLSVSVSKGKKKTAKAEEEKPVLESVFHDKRNSKDSFAYINGTLYRKGASVLGFKILRILKDSVKIKDEKNGKESILKLRTASPAAKKTPVPLVLQSISFDPNDETKSLAALNGVLYHQGESWENFELTKILAEEVLLTDKSTGKTQQIRIDKLAQQQDGRPDIEIQVILYNEKKKENSQVAINGKLYKPGELVEGYEILDIGKSHIRVRKKGDISWETHVINNLPAEK